MSELVKLAHESLLGYCAWQQPKYRSPEHIVKIAKILERVEAGELKRVIITIPPRHGKSMLCSQFFPAWYIGRNPDKQIITATYGQELSDDFGRKVRDQIQSIDFKAVFKTCELDRRTQAANRMTTMSGGAYFGVGAGGAITGRGANLLLIDDPVKNREEADSQTMRDKLYDWYRSVAYTRLMPNGAVVVIMTRWHQDDLVARILANDTNDNWTVVNLPALSDDLQPLWPDAYNITALQDIRQTIGEFDWQCLYQQNPIPHEGILFKPDWMPPGLAPSDDYSCKFVAVDPAISTKDSADETAISVVGLGFGEHPKIYEIETCYGHWTFNEQLNAIKNLYNKHRPDYVGIEDVAYQKALIQEASRLDIPVAPLKAFKDKVARAMSVSHYFSQGRICVNTPKLKQQMLSFRGGDEKNDLADAFIHAITMVRDYSQERYDKQAAKPDYAKMDPHQRFLQEALRQEMGQLTGRSESTHLFDRAARNTGDFY